MQKFQFFEGLLKKIIEDTPLESTTKNILTEFPIILCIYLIGWIENIKKPHISTYTIVYLL